MLSIEAILDLIDQRRINRDVLMKHDVARERYGARSLQPASAAEFHDVLVHYVQHHQRSVGEGECSREAAFGEAKRILDHAFSQDQFQEGYNVALQHALDGGMLEVLNELHAGLKRRALQEYLDAVFYEHVDPLSHAENVALSRAYYEHFRVIFERVGMPLDELSFASNTRAAFEYHRQVMEMVVGTGRKIWGRK